MPEAMTELESKLADLRKHYVDGIGVKYAEIERGWQAMGRTVDEEQRETLIRKAHSFAGSGTMYGFVEISEAARNFERILVEIRESGSVPSSDQMDEGHTRLGKLGDAIRESILQMESGQA